MSAVGSAELLSIKDPRLVNDLAAGKPVVLYDREQRTTSLAFAAATASTELVSFAVRHGSGLLFVALPEPDCHRLGLPRMVGARGDSTSGDLRVTVDAAEGIGTGISAADRARTIRLLGRPGGEADDFRRPGHVMTVAVPLPAPCDCCRPSAPSSAAVAVEAVARTGLPPAAALTHLVHPDTAEPLDYVAALRFGREHRVQVADLIEVLADGGTATLPTLLPCVQRTS